MFCILDDFMFTLVLQHEQTILIKKWVYSCGFNESWHLQYSRICNVFNQRNANDVCKVWLCRQLLQQKIPSFLTWWEYCLTSKTEHNFFEQVKTTQVKTSTSKKDSIPTPSIVAFWNPRTMLKCISLHCIVLKRHIWNF